MTQTTVFKKLFCLLVVLVLNIAPANAQNLSDIYELALQNDPALKEAHFNQLATDEIKDQSIARFLPSVDVTAASSGNRLYNSRNTFQGFGVQEFWSHSISVDLVQPLFHWDHWIQLSQSDNQLAEAEATYQAALQGLMVRTTEAYFNVLLAQDNLDFYKAEKGAISQQLQQAQQLLKMGLIMVIEVHETQAALDEANANEIDAANKLDNQKEILLEIIGDQNIQLRPLDQKIVLAQPQPNDLSAWSKTAETANLIIISALNKMEIARKSIDIQRNGHLPKLDLVASYGANQTGSTFGLNGDTQSVGLQFNLPLFEGGAVNSKIRQASHEYEAAKETLNAQKRSVKRQVTDSFRGIVTSISRVGALEAAVVSAEKALQATEAGLESGTRTMLDVLDEQRKLYQAKRDYADARYGYVINTVKLKQAASSLNKEDIDQINKLLI